MALAGLVLVEAGEAAIMALVQPPVLFLRQPKRPIASSAR
jgi:hypothetical protein